MTYRTIALALLVIAGPFSAQADIALTGDTSFGVTGGQTTTDADLGVHVGTVTDDGAGLGAKVGIRVRSGLSDCTDGGVHRAHCFPGVSTRPTPPPSPQPTTGR